MTLTLNEELLERCANDPHGPVALHLHQELLPVEGRGAPLYPPTFAIAEKYNIDKLADGTAVALVDSVGSQANRMEPLFLQPTLRTLVPQIEITYGDAAKGTDGKVSLLEAGHRLGDAVVRCTELAEEAQQAFLAQRKGDSAPLARLAPTSLVFGAWDSRDTGVKIPRIVQAAIRAWNVSPLTRSAQFVPALEYANLGIIADEDKLKEAEKKVLAERGFIHVPAAGEPGGIVAEGPIRRDVTVNLIALRRLDAPEKAQALRRYVMGLGLVAATAPPDPFLRQGCLLVPDPDVPAHWELVERDGRRSELQADHEAVVEWSRVAAEAFGVGQDRSLAFDAKRAQADTKKGKKK